MGCREADLAQCMSCQEQCIGKIWSDLPPEVQARCFVPLLSREVGKAATASRSEWQVACSDDVWANIFSRDWSWLCPFGPPSWISFRAYHARLLNGAAAFAVLGGIVRRTGEAGHTDEALLSMLATEGNIKTWSSAALGVPGRCATGLCGDCRGQVYSVGGFDFSAELPLGFAEALDVTSVLNGVPNVRSLPQMQRSRACPGLVALRDSLLAVGGGSSMFTIADAFQSTELLRLDTDECEYQKVGWQQAPFLLKRRCAAGVCTTDAGHVYAISGYAGNDTYEASVECLDGFSNEGLSKGWKMAPSLKQARAGCVACFGPEGCIWALGGGCDESESLASVERLDPRMKAWLGGVPDMPGRRRCFAGGFSTDRRLYVYGGWDSTQWHNPTAARFDVRTMTWESLPSLSGGEAEDEIVIPYHFVSGCVAI